MAGHETSFMATSTFWALISLIIFLAILAYMKVPAWLLGYLDERAERIDKELEEARRLREEAQQLLGEYQKKRSETEAEAEEIIAIAKREAKLLIEETNQETKAYIERRNKVFEEKINQTEADALLDIRRRAAQLAIEAAKIAIEKDMDEETYDRILSSSLQTIKRNLN